MLKAVLLDVDGTLVDTNYLHVEAWAQAFEAIGRPVPRAVIHPHIGKGADQFLPEFLDDPGLRERADELHSRLYPELRKHGYPLPGAADLLIWLHDRGVETWIATSARPEEVDELLEQLGADGTTAGVVSSEQVEASKPAPDVFAVALERAGVRPEEAVAIGDAVWDVRAAGRAGVRTIAVLTGGGAPADELEREGAIAVFKDCAELLASGLLERL